MSAVMNFHFPVPQIDRKTKQVKEQWHTKNKQLTEYPAHTTYGEMNISDVRMTMKYSSHWQLCVGARRYNSACSFCYVCDLCVFSQSHNLMQSDEVTKSLYNAW